MSLMIIINKEQIVAFFLVFPLIFITVVLIGELIEEAIRLSKK